MKTSDLSEQKLLKREMTHEGTVENLMNRTPEKWKSAVIAGAYECLK